MCHTVLSMRSSHTFHEGQTKMGLCLEKLHRRKVCYQKNLSVVYPKDSSSTNQRMALAGSNHTLMVLTLVA